MSLAKTLSLSSWQSSLVLRTPFTVDSVLTTLNRCNCRKEARRQHQRHRPQKLLPVSRIHARYEVPLLGLPLGLPLVIPPAPAAVTTRQAQAVAAALHCFSATIPHPRRTTPVPEHGTLPLAAAAEGRKAQMPAAVAALLQVVGLLLLLARAAGMRAALSRRVQAWVSLPLPTALRMEAADPDCQRP